MWLRKLFQSWKFKGIYIQIDIKTSQDIPSSTNGKNIYLGIAVNMY